MSQDRLRIAGKAHTAMHSVPLDKASQVPAVQKTNPINTVETPIFDSQDDILDTVYKGLWKRLRWKTTP